jgi:hypothetical protein
MTVNQANQVNANASTKEDAVKVTKARGFRFGGSKTVATEAAFA